MKVPYLNAEVSIILQNAVFNDCYQLTNANSTAELPTVFAEYHPSWKNVTDADQLIQSIIQNFRNSLQGMKDILNNFSGKCEDVRNLDKEVKSYEQSFNQSNAFYSETERSTILSNISILKTKLSDLITCSGCTISSGRINTSDAVSADCGVKAQDCIAGVNQLLSLSKESTNLLIGNITCGCDKFNLTPKEKCDKMKEILLKIKMGYSLKRDQEIINTPLLFGDLTIDGNCINSVNINFSPTVPNVIVNPVNYTSDLSTFTIKFGADFSISLNGTGTKAFYQSVILEQYLFGVGNKPKFPITGTQLYQIFHPTYKETTLARCDEVANAINKYSNKFGLTNAKKMSHFIGQIGAETGGLVYLKERNPYTPRRVVEVWAKTPKYADLF